MTEFRVDYFRKDEGDFNRCPYCFRILVKSGDCRFGDFYCNGCGKEFSELVFNQDVLREILNIIKGEGSELAKIFGPDLHTYNNKHGNLLYEYCLELERKGLVYKAIIDRHHYCILWKVKAEG